MTDTKPSPQNILNSKYINGYRIIQIPYYEKNKWVCEDYVYEHIYLMELELERFLSDNEEVHHLDGDRSNNRLSNLVVMTCAHHVRLHHWLNNGAVFDTKTPKINTCKVCSKSLIRNGTIFCSQECTHINQKKVERPSKNVLIAELMELNFKQVGLKYGVSDNSIRKWCKAYKISSKSEDYQKSKEIKEEIVKQKHVCLSSEQKSEILELYEPKSNQFGAKALSIKYGVNKTTIRDILIKAGLTL